MTINGRARLFPQNKERRSAACGVATEGRELHFCQDDTSHLGLAPPVNMWRQNLRPEVTKVLLTQQLSSLYRDLQQAPQSFLWQPSTPSPHLTFTQPVPRVLSLLSPTWLFRNFHPPSDCVGCNLFLKRHHPPRAGSSDTARSSVKLFKVRVGPFDEIFWHIAAAGLCLWRCLFNNLLSFPLFFFFFFFFRFVLGFQANTSFILDLNCLTLFLHRTRHAGGREVRSQCQHEGRRRRGKWENDNNFFNL